MRERAESVPEARVFRRRKREVREPDLPQARASRCTGAASTSATSPIIEFDEMVNGIEDPLH